MTGGPSKSRCVCVCVLFTARQKGRQQQGHDDFPMNTHPNLRCCAVQFALDDRSATVQLGTTTAMAAITAELTTPYNDRAREGSVK